MSSALVKAELSATCNTLGYLHGDQYSIDPQCYESIRDLIRFLRRDDEYHEIRRYLGEAKIVESDLIHILENCDENQNELFDITVRLLVNLTSPVMLLYKEELPVEKVGRNIYLTILGHLQDCKVAFTSIAAWKKISSKLSDLFEIDWSERSEDAGLQIERMLVLIRNVLQIPADDEHRVDNDVSVHDQVLWGLRQSQILELLLYIASNRDEAQYFIHILEIFSLILREQDPKLLADCEMSRSNEEKEKDNEDLIFKRQNERKIHAKKFSQYARHSNFGGTYVLQNVKSISEKSAIYHKPLQKLKEIGSDKQRLKTPKNRIPEKTERDSRRSTFSVRLFLKELCVEFLSSCYNGLMSVVKDKIVSGKALPNDESYYFWGMRFFMEFNRLAKLDIKHVTETVGVSTFHYIQTQIENCFDRITIDKKKINVWVKRLHIIMKAYRELLETLNYMEHLPNVKNTIDVLKSQLFYMPEYRELVLTCLFKYDPTKFSKDYLKTLIETSHLFLKMLKNFCDGKNKKIVVQTKKKKKEHRKSKAKNVEINARDKWLQIKDQIKDLLTNNTEFPEISPFNPDFELESEEQKESAMRRIQNMLYNNKLVDGIGLLRSCRTVWPELNYFGHENMDIDEECSGLEDIFTAELGNKFSVNEEGEAKDDDGDDEDNDQNDAKIVSKEESLEYTDFIKRLANWRVVEACAELLKNYEKNSAFTNHCTIKMLHRIGWECFMPSMLFQASFFCTLLRIMNDNRSQYKEINKFAVHLIRKFRQNAEQNPKIYMELLFWKDSRLAFEVENGYNTESGKSKAASWSEEQEDELRRLCVEFDQSHPENADKVDWVCENLIDASRTRRAVMRKLREMYLIPAGPQQRAKKRPPIEWSSEEMAQLEDLFNQFKGAVDIVGVIADRLNLKRPKKRIADKIVELGLVNSHADLRKRRGKRISHQQHDSESESSESSSDEEAPVDSAPVQTFSIFEQKQALIKVAENGLTEALDWLKECFQDYFDDYDPTDDGYPLLAIEPSQIDALQNENFTDMLVKLGVTPPGDQQYWRLPGTYTKHHLELMINIIQQAVSGELQLDKEPSTQDDSDDALSVNIKKTQDSDSGSRTERMESSPSARKAQILSEDESNASYSLQSSRSPRIIKTSTQRSVNSDAESDNESISSNTKLPSSRRSRKTIDSEGESSNSSVKSLSNSFPVNGKSSNKKRFEKLKKNVNSSEEASEGSVSPTYKRVTVKKHSRIKSNAFSSGSEEEDNGRDSMVRSTHFVGSDSDDAGSSTYPKRNRLIINSDSEGEFNSSQHDSKRRKTLMDSDSENDSSFKPDQRKIVIGEDTYEMEK